jgi:uncharacterized protein YggE
MDNQTMSKPVRNSIIAVLAIILIFVVAQHVSGGSWEHSGSAADRPHITVMGKGEAFAVPDIGTFTFSVIENGKTVKEAQDNATDRTNKAIDYLKKAGIAEKDIKTVNYNVNPQYDYSKRACVSSAPCNPNGILVGYQTVATIEVKVRDTSKAGELLTGIGSLGVQNISSLNFTIDDDTAIVRQARQKAIDDAKTQAEQLAKDLKVRLVRIVDFQESGNYPVFYSKAMAADSAAPQAAPVPQLPTGENKITSNVTITYEIR